MKSFPFLVIFCLLFNLPTVEGQQTILGLLLNILFFTPKRNERDCKALILSSGVNDTEDCYCKNYQLGPQASFYCSTGKKCLSPSDSTFCSDSIYSAESKDRKRLALHTSLDVREEKLYARASIAGNYIEVSSTFEFAFARGDADSPSFNKYTNCSAYVLSYDSVTQIESYPYYCTSCDICDSGVDFKYNCSKFSVNGAYVFGNETLRYTYYPGPIVDSCFPIADFIHP